MRRGDEVTEAVLLRPGRYRKIADNLEVKEVVVGGGAMQCASTHRRPIDSAPIAPSASLSSRPNSPAWPIRTRADTASAYARYRRFLKETKHGLAIDRQGIAELERFDGKFVVHSNDDTLTAEDMALGYKQQQRVEEAWRTMKGGLRMRPVFHWAPHRIHAHIAITVLSLLL